MNSAKATITALRSISTCELSDALVKLGVSHGGLIPDLRMYSPQGESGDTRIAGPAFTVQMVHVAHPDKRKPDQHFIDACPPDSVLVIQTPPGVKSGCWGGLMSTAAQAKGIPGVVIDGNCRDLTEHRDLFYPVFARSHTTLGPSGFTRVIAHNVPLDIHPVVATPPSESYITFPHTTVNPGDYVVADLDGCIVVPRDMADEVVKRACAARDIDEKVREDLIAGHGVVESMLKWRGKAP